MRTPNYLVEYFPDGDGWGASVPDLPGCQTCGDTLDEVKKYIKEAIRGYVDSMIEDGLPVPPASHISETVTVELSA